MRRTKYGNSKTRIGDLVFDSKLEARRWQELKMLEAAGEIYDLDRQYPLTLSVRGHKICKWIVDFVYRATGGTLVFEDVKGMVTRDAAIKLKLARALFPEARIEIWRG
jgi:hypothetical protein